MTERNFTLGVAYSKSELIQVAVFGFVFLGDRVGAADRGWRSRWERWAC